MRNKSQNTYNQKIHKTRKLRHTFLCWKSYRTFICHWWTMCGSSRPMKRKQLKTRAQFTTISTTMRNNHASIELIQSTADLTLISARSVGLRIDWTELTVTEATELFGRGGDLRWELPWIRGVEFESKSLKSVLVQDICRLDRKYQWFWHHEGLQSELSSYKSICDWNFCG